MDSLSSLAHKATDEAQALTREWGTLAIVALVPICFGAYVVETFATEPLVDAWYADNSVTTRFRAIRFTMLVIAEFYTIATSGYGLI